MKFFCEIFYLGGVTPPNLPLQHLLAACGRSGPFEGVFGEKKFWVNFFGGVGDPPLSLAPSSTPWRPAAAVEVEACILSVVT